MSSSRSARRSIGAMVAASLVGAFCGVVQTFWIPRLLTVDQFGYWRTFVLYTGYAGLLHFGLVDGSLLIWSRSSLPSSESRAYLWKTFQFLAFAHLLLVAFTAVSAALFPNTFLAPLFIAVAVYATLFNLIGLIQIYLQSQLRFSAVALAIGAPSVLFVPTLAVLALAGHPTAGGLRIAYLACWAAVLLLTIAIVLLPGLSPTGDREQPREAKPMSAWRLGIDAIATGWPIMLANMGFGLMQSADRVTVNLTRPIQDFAIYSLSQSTIYVPITLLGALSRVAFSYLARVSDEDRAMGYRSSTRLLALFWMLLLPYYFAVEFVVVHFLPRYMAGLDAGRILLFSVMFLSLIQIVQLNSFSLEGKQRTFFAGSLFAVATAFLTAWIGSRFFDTLSAVAWSQVVTSGLWWLANEGPMLRQRSCLTWPDRLAVLACFGFGAAGLCLAEAEATNVAGKVLLYYLFEAIPFVLLFRGEIQGFRLALNASRAAKRLA